MTIAPTDWVWFSHRGYGYTQFSRFADLNQHLQNVIDRLFTKRCHAPYLMFDIYEKIDVHLVLPKEGENFRKEINILSKGLNSPVYSVFRLPSGNHWIDGKAPNFRPADALRANYMPRSGWKELALHYVEHLSKFLKPIESPPTFSKVETKTLKPLTMPIGSELVVDFLKRYKKLEESPMKVKQHLVELNKLDDNGKPSSNRGVILVKYASGKFTLDKVVVDLINMLFIDTTNPKHLTQDILTIEDGSYKLGSGDTKYTDERFKLLTHSTPVLVEVDMTSPVPITLQYEYMAGDKPVKGTSEIEIPTEADTQRVLSYHQQKWPNKNYTLVKKIVQKKLSERSKELATLPKKGETPAKELRKVCYRRKDGERIFRGPYKKVKELVDSGDFVYASKKAWKSQVLKVEEDGSKTVVLDAEKPKTNITHSPNGKPLGERKRLREEREEERKLKAYRKSMRLHQSTSKPGDAERKLQSSADKKKYAEKCVATGKKRVSHRQSRSYEAVILGDKAVVLKTIHIKAKSSTHADMILHRMITFNKKAESGSLTGNVRDWVKPTGKQRPKRKSSARGPGTRKPRLTSPAE